MPDRWTAPKSAKVNLQKSGHLPDLLPPDVRSKRLAQDDNLAQTRGHQVHVMLILRGSLLRFRSVRERRQANGRQRAQQLQLGLGG